ncbi:MAG: cysteine desulfurase [Thermodesulfovibrionales bacterium]|nr:cysteine desulfurase [Thermodesulfovibrionales bacterium]
MKTHYFDYVATNPLKPEVLEVMMPFLKEDFGNPLSNYPPGIKAREAIELAREKVAALIGAPKPGTVVFTASGAEANNMALRGLALAKKDKGSHVIISKLEHHSILNTARFLEKQGFVTSYLPVDKHGLVDPEDLKRAMTKETVLVSVIHASSEVGSIQPIKELAAIAKEGGASFHTDAVASVGNIPVDVEELGVDALSLSAHQFGGPKGAAALYVKGGTRIVPLIYGGIQEGGRRAGTENVPAIVGMGKAASIAAQMLPVWQEPRRKFRDRLMEGVLKTENVILTGHPTQRLPHHASFCAEYIEGEAMLLMLAAKGIYVASGSACSSKALKSSPILLAMAIPTGLAQGSVVFSFGDNINDDDIDYVLEEFPAIITRLREISPFAKDGWGDSEEGK